ncbi:putative calcyclin-binding protein [Paratrimastix pyriformis]|uniref:Calcyclin-binding protein n=1 Tax=Paratrimastix pyriformis TaxID=342808 RepID=A0ABQ8UVI5_9EUKA|nr:putative calcyclin-binding protein [Paratrimastix pyriformis]
MIQTFSVPTSDAPTPAPAPAPAPAPTSTSSSPDPVPTQMDPRTELEADIAEVNRLIGLSQRAPVTAHLQAFLETLRQRKAALAPVEPAKPVAVTRVAPELTIPWVDLKNFSWTQENGFVEIYLELANVGTVPTEHVHVTVQANAIGAVVEGLEGKNYRFTQNPLCHPIDPAASLYRVRPNRIYFKLKKAKESEYWDSVQMRADRFSEALKKEKYDYSDPSKGLMDLMKNLYESGDDEMKRTIAKSHLYISRFHCQIAKEETISRGNNLWRPPELPNNLSLASHAFAALAVSSCRLDIGTCRSANSRPPVWWLVPAPLPHMAPLLKANAQHIALGDLQTQAKRDCYSARPLRGAVHQRVVAGQDQMTQGDGGQRPSGLLGRIDPFSTLPVLVISLPDHASRDDVRPRRGQVAGARGSPGSSAALQNGNFQFCVTY